MIRRNRVGGNHREPPNEITSDFYFWLARTNLRTKNKKSRFPEMYAKKLPTVRKSTDLGRDSRQSGGMNENTDHDSATAECRHIDCGKRFTLSRYGNRTHTSERTRKQHLFCSPGCRVAHHRRMAAPRGLALQKRLPPRGGVTERTSAVSYAQRTELLMPPKTTRRSPRMTTGLS